MCFSGGGGSNVPPAKAPKKDIQAANVISSTGTTRSPITQERVTRSNQIGATNDTLGKPGAVQPTISSVEG